MGSNKLTILLAAIILAGFALYYFSQDASHSASEVNKIYSDSVAVPDRRPSITAQKDTNPEPVGEDFAPKTALIKATILSVEYTNQQPHTIRVQVDEVLGYGPSTMPLPTGTELTFDISGFLKANPQYSSAISRDAEIKALIASHQAVKGQQSPKWTLVELKQ